MKQTTALKATKRINKPRLHVHVNNILNIICSCI